MRRHQHGDVRTRAFPAGRHDRRMSPGAGNDLNDDREHRHRKGDTDYDQGRLYSGGHDLPPFLIVASNIPESACA
jgi:hypothetical protein